MSGYNAFVSFQFNYCTIKSHTSVIYQTSLLHFNSTIVRLKDVKTIIAHKDIQNFNSTIVRLKVSFALTVIKY